MIIAVDWDCVLNNLMDKVIEIYNAQSGKNIQMSDLASYNFYDCLAKEDADGIMKLFKNKTMWDALTPIQGSREGLQKLLDANHKVYVVTATATENWSWKISWFKKYFPFFNTDNIIRMKDKSLFKCQIMIDDCYDNLVGNKLCHKICLDYPWNRDDVKDWVHGTYRCKNWSEIVASVNKIQDEVNEWIGK